MTKTEVTIRTRSLMVNPLLNRKQFLVDIYHPGQVQPTFEVVKAELAKMFKVKDVQTIQLSGFETKFGGSKTTGFGIIYDTLSAMKKYSPRHILIRAKLSTKTRAPRKARKEIKKKARLSHDLKDYKRKEAKKASKKKK